MTRGEHGPGAGHAIGLALVAGMLLGGDAACAAGGDASLSAGEREAIFKAAGAVQRRGKWLLCADDPATSGATIAQVTDLNGDGNPEALLTEDGTFCYGHTGTGFQLLSRQIDGGWRTMMGGAGIPIVLATRGVGGWPDISIGGPGFCFPVQRWNGKAYALHRFEYEGKRCRPPR